MQDREGVIRFFLNHVKPGAVYGVTANLTSEGTAPFHGAPKRPLLLYMQAPFMVKQ